MKKFLAMLVAAMMVLSLVAIPVFADGEVVFAVENAPATATPGDETPVTHRERHFRSTCTQHAVQL